MQLSLISMKNPGVATVCEPKDGFYIVGNSSIAISSGLVHLSISKRGSLLTPYEEVMIDLLIHEQEYPISSTLHHPGVGHVDSYFVMPFKRFSSLMGQSNLVNHMQLPSY